jgi:hypothetical protein
VVVDDEHPERHLDIVATRRPWEQRVNPVILEPFLPGPGRR